MTKPTRRGAPFAAHHPWDRNFFLAFVALCWFGVVMGFGPQVMLRFTGKADYPASIVLQIHAIAFPAWLVLLTLQVLLVRVRRTDLHRRLGVAALALIPVMAVTGIWAEILSQRFYGPEPENQSFFIIPIAYVVMFTVLAGAALVLRRAPPAHKRLMLVANATIVGAAYARWLGAPIAGVVGDGFFGMIANTYFAFYVMMACAAAYDVATRGRVHMSYVIAIALSAGAHLIVSAIYHAAAWRPIARSIIGN